MTMKTKGNVVIQQCFRFYSCFIYNTQQQTNKIKGVMLAMCAVINI